MRVMIECRYETLFSTSHSLRAKDTRPMGGGGGGLSNHTWGASLNLWGLCVIPKIEFAKLWGPPIPSPPLCEEVRRHKVSGRGQTVLSPQTQVGLGEQ